MFNTKSCVILRLKGVYYEMDTDHDTGYGDFIKR